MYVMVKQRKCSTVTTISLLQNRCHRISHHRFYFFSISLNSFFCSLLLLQQTFFYFFLLEEMQRPHFFDCLSTKQHQHFIEEARDNQTIKQQVDVCALVAVMRVGAQMFFVVILLFQPHTISFFFSFTFASICPRLTEYCITQIHTRSITINQLRMDTIFIYISRQKNRQKERKKENNDLYI
jgi:hypothetical protein